MSRKLDILIPQYKEDEKVIKPLLDSIAIQQNVDFNYIGVIIVNDGTDVKLSEEFLKSYPFTIEYYQNEHKGVSGTRNACLDHSTADYVMFCDIDDMFCDVCGLYMIFNEIDRTDEQTKQKGFDTLTSVFREEGRHPQTKEVIYINRGMAPQIDSTFVHGKIHNRKFLINNNIRWNDSLTIHEDSYFNCLCQRLANPLRVKYCPMPFYLWKWRDESVCRRDPKYILKTMPNMLASNTALVEQFVERGKIDDAKFFATSMVFDCYYQINCKQWLENENAEFKLGLEKCFKQYFEKFEYLYNDINKDIRLQIIAGIRNRFFQEGLDLESITFEDWIKHIKELEI